MKRYLFAFAFVLVLSPFVFAHNASATSCSPEDTTNNGGCAATEYCDGSVTDAQGNGTCKLLSSVNTNNPANNLNGATSPATGDTGFVPLTHLPQITNLASSDGFATFVNTFYKILIGLGSVLAVIMIMIAGVEFMGSKGSVTSNEKAKGHIRNAIFGLVLLLAPAIVFGIINPDILQLNLGKEFTSLKQTPVDQNAFTATSTPAPTNGANTYLLAFYYTFTDDATGKQTCYGGTVQSFPTQQECVAQKSTISATTGTITGQTRSAITYLNSCELGDASSVSITPPSGLPLCPTNN